MGGFAFKAASLRAKGLKWICGRWQVLPRRRYLRHRRIHAI